MGGFVRRSSDLISRMQLTTDAHRDDVDWRSCLNLRVPAMIFAIHINLDEDRRFV